MPGRLDETRPFLPVNIALLTVSDTRPAADDLEFGSWTLS